MKISKKDLKEIIKEEIEASMDEDFRMRDMVPSKVRGKFKDTFSAVPDPTTDRRVRPSEKAKEAWKQLGGEISTFDADAIAQFHELAGLKISLKDYMDNIKYARKNERLGQRILSLVDALALANQTGSRRGHLKFAKKKSSKPPQFTRESIASLEEMIDEEIEALMAEDDDWIQKAVDPDHEGYCTPMTKSTCTPARKALAKRFKKAAKKKEKKGGTGWQGKV